MSNLKLEADFIKNVIALRKIADVVLRQAAQLGVPVAPAGTQKRKKKADLIAESEADLKVRLLTGRRKPLSRK